MILDVEQIASAASKIPARRRYRIGVLAAKNVAYRKREILKIIFGKKRKQLLNEPQTAVFKLYEKFWGCYTDPKTGRVDLNRIKYKPERIIDDRDGRRTCIAELMGLFGWSYGQTRRFLKLGNDLGVFRKVADAIQVEKGRYVTDLTMYPNVDIFKNAAVKLDKQMREEAAKRGKAKKAQKEDEGFRTVRVKSNGGVTVLPVEVAVELAPEIAPEPTPETSTEVLDAPPESTELTNQKAEIISESPAYKSVRSLSLSEKSDSDCLKSESQANSIEGSVHQLGDNERETHPRSASPSGDGNSLFSFLEVSTDVAQAVEKLKTIFPESEFKPQHIHLLDYRFHRCFDPKARMTQESLDRWICYRNGNSNLPEACAPEDLWFIGGVDLTFLLSAWKAVQREIDKHVYAHSLWDTKLFLKESSSSSVIAAEIDFKLHYHFRNMYEEIKPCNWLKSILHAPDFTTLMGRTKSEQLAVTLSRFLIMQSSEYFTEICERWSNNLVEYFKSWPEHYVSLKNRGFEVDTWLSFATITRPNFVTLLRKQFARAYGVEMMAAQHGSEALI